MAALGQSRQSGDVPIEEGTLTRDLAVPLKAIPFKCLKNAPVGAGCLARGVNVFNAQQPVAAGPAGIQVAGDGRDERAEMERPSGRGRKAPDIPTGFRLGRAQQTGRR